MSVQLPRMIVYEESTTETLAAVASGGLVASFFSNAVLAAIMNFSLSILWSCLNALQLVVHMPMFAIKYPANAYDFNESLIGIASFDILDHYELQAKMFYWPDVDAYNLNFETLGYDSIFFNPNIGTMFFMILILLILILLVVLLHLMSSASKSI